MLTIYIFQLNCATLKCQARITFFLPPANVTSLSRITIPGGRIIAFNCAHRRRPTSIRVSRKIALSSFSYLVRARRLSRRRRGRRIRACGRKYEAGCRTCRAQEKNLGSYRLHLDAYREQNNLVKNNSGEARKEVLSRSNKDKQTFVCDRISSPMLT